MFVVLTLLAACGTATAPDRLFIATGFKTGVYFRLGTTLSAEWGMQLGVEQRRVVETNGSIENIERLRSGDVDVAFSAADVAIDQGARPGPRRPRALARIYDDYLHIAVRAGSSIAKVSDLAGKRVSIGAKDSGVEVIAERVLELAAPDMTGPPITRDFGLATSSQALLDGTIDAFFWSGGLPTEEIANLAQRVPLRLLDLGDLMPKIRAKYSYYGAAAIPVSAYKLPGPVTTLVVSNFLLVTDAMSPDTAAALTQGIFEAQPKLAAANSAAASIDLRSAIETRPVPLHEGALRYYRDNKV
jgi:TRAP transporter TAXI family solute receptor